MRGYARVSPTIWTGATGKELRRGGHAAMTMGLYLITSPHSNMLGLFYQPLLYAAHETGLGADGASKGLAACIEAGFCKYDAATETVWVMSMAKWQVAESLQATDKRCQGIQKDYEALLNNPFLGPFFDRYSAAFHLSRRREGQPTSQGCIEGPSEALLSQEQAQEQEQEQEKEQAKAKKSPRAARATPIPPDFAISERVAKWAMEKGYGRLQEHLEVFKMKAGQKGYRNVDWDLALMAAIRDDWAKLRISGVNGIDRAAANAEAKRILNIGHDVEVIDA